MTDKCGGGYAASRQELTAPGGKPPTRCLRRPSATEKKRGGGAVVFKNRLCLGSEHE